jgi:hypothetical protein
MTGSQGEGSLTPRVSARQSGKPRDLLADCRLTCPSAHALSGRFVPWLPGYCHEIGGFRNVGRTDGWGEALPCGVGIPGELTRWRVLAPSRGLGLPCFADGSGVASKRKSRSFIHV